ncbi:MAG: TetR/AcrR family transcriptional regulator, partial [Firmicutes bacterium]|nr:TetR/AcrR family transcriptional regulator [Bacillota bacterium]
MPPKCRFTREQIVLAALDLTRREGIGAVTARAVGAELNSSSKVVFGLFESMEELQLEVIHAADAYYQARIRQEMAAGRYPPYKASGMAYIGFAKEEPELFRLLFMRDRTRETQASESAETQMLTGMLRDSMGLSEESARIFHLE